jgi:anti-anti-sigma factor
MRENDRGSTNFRAAWTPGSSTVEVVGEIDVTSASALAETLDAALARVRPPIRLDMTEVTFIDASVLGVLVRVQKRYDTDGSAVVEVVAGLFVDRVLRLAQLERFLVP